MTQMGSLRGADAVQQQLGNLRLAIELGLSHTQITFRLAMIIVKYIISKGKWNKVKERFNKEH